MKKTLLAFFIFSVCALTAQQSKIDSLKKILTSPVPDSVRSLVYFDLAIYSQNDLDSAMYFANMNIKLGEKTKNKTFLANGYLSSGHIFQEQANYKSALENFLKSIELYTQSINETSPENNYRIYNLKRFLARAYTSCVNPSLGLNNASGALAYAEKSLVLFKSINYKAGEVDAYNNMGICYRKLNKLQEAIKFYFESIKVAEANHMPVGLSYLNLGNIYVRQQQLNEGLDKYKIAIRVLNSEHNLKGVAMTLNNMGNAYSEKKDLVNALFYFKKSLEVSVPRKDRSTMVFSYNGLGITYFDMKEYNEALFYLNKAKEIISQTGEISMKTGNLHLLSEVYMATNKLKEAEQVLKEAAVLADSTHDFELISENNLRLYQLYSKRGDYKLALKYYIAHKAFADSLNNQAAHDKLIRSEMDFGFEKEKAVNKAEQEKKDALLAAEKKQKAFIVAALVVILILFALSYISFRRTDKLKKQLELAVTQKETLLKEIHHRVKNNLQFISSLLSIHSRYVDDKALAVVKESRDRVRAMAIIHQDLYQKEDITSLNVKDYLNKLADNFKDSYQLENITIETEAGDFDLDVDTMIPLGLIINELVTNSIKYAFAQSGQGQVNISVNKNERDIVLRVSDTGSGFPENFSEGTTSSFGYKLIGIFKDKFKASLTIANRNGAFVEMIIPHPA